MVREKAQQLAVNMDVEFEPTLGWLYRWQKREGISVKQIHGEGASANIKSANDFFELLPNLIQNYSAKDIFNADESGLSYKALPRSSLTSSGDNSKEFKSSKERLTCQFVKESFEVEELSQEAGIVELVNSDEFLHEEY
ncbi:PREDICTED: tigger transposable element-derived protein 6-like [Bactrocera latifrons]|uniref:tigger transposable element-derived protein 6-like n=1 Tax=Bactrocera latifrons TaxID=174628 RepID=UPI0008DD6A9E|nr:PREDICTED: tigger transposable element-derived protein 6-like [Bactrocera latifrons]